MLWKFLRITVGAVLNALAVVVFLIPADVVPSGVSGLAVILNELIGTPVGIVIILMNIPIMILGYRMLPGGWPMVMRTVFVIVLSSMVIDLLMPYMPEGGYSDDRFLNALFGGILGGISAGIIYQAGANLGGTSTLALIVQRRLGTPLSSTILYTDTLVIFIAGFVFGLEGALYALVVIFIGGIAADYVMEGPAVIRTAVIITDKPEEVSQAIINQLHRGVTMLPAKGMYTGKERAMLYITVMRTQVNELRQLIAEVDSGSFVVIGQGHTAYGVGFRPVNGHKSSKALPQEERQNTP